jgi:hypothetical protein
MGWLDAMEELYLDLQKGTNKSIDVKIGMMNNHLSSMRFIFSSYL